MDDEKGIVEKLKDGERLNEKEIITVQTALLVWYAADDAVDEAFKLL